MSFFGLDGEGDVSANVLYSNGLKIQDTNQDGSTITEIMSLTTSGNAIVTQEELAISSAIDSRLRLFKASESAQDTGNLILNRHRGDFASPTALQDGDVVGMIGFAGYDGSAIATNGNAAIYSKVNGVVDDSNIPLDLYFSTDPAGNAIGSSDMVFTQDGLMGVGTESPIERLHSAERITFYEGLRIGNDDVCSAANDYGVIRYTGSAFEYCDTTNAWVNLVDGNASTTPTEFDPELANCTYNEGGPFVEVADFNTPGSSTGIWRDDSYIYVADHTAGIRAYTFDGTTLTEVGNFATANNAYTVWGDGTYVYLAAGTTGLHAFTFDGTNFTEIDVFNTPNLALGVWGDGTYVYVADSASVRAYTFDGSVFAEVGSYSTITDASEVWGDGDYIYVGDGTSGVRALTFDGTTFTQVGLFDTPDEAYAAWGDGDYIYVADGAGGVHVYSFDGTNFVELADVTTTDSAEHIWGDGVNIYVAEGTDGIVAYKFNGRILSEVGRFDTPASAQHVWTDGEYVYLADWTSGIRVYSGFKCLSTAPQKEDVIDWTRLENTEVKIFPADGASGDAFGNDVIISGNYLIASATGDDDNGSSSGSVYVFDIISGTQIHKLTASDGEAGDIFGEETVVEGNYIVVGAWSEDVPGTDSGAVYVFDMETGTELYKLESPNPEGASEFGTAVAASGNYLIVGEEKDNNERGIDAGAAYVFNLSTGEYLYRILPDDLVVSDLFGVYTKISGKYAMIGARRGDGAVANSGTVYIYNLETGTQVHKLEASDGALNDNFMTGNISEKYIVVGARSDDDSFAGSGSLYVFDMETGTELYKLNHSDALAGDALGNNVEISGNYLFANAQGANSAEGALYIFNLTTGEQINKIIGSDVGTGDAFSDGIAVSGNLLVTSASAGPGNTADSGAVYLYRGRWTDRVVSDTDCYPYSLKINDITGAVASTDVTTNSIILKSFARDCRLTLSSESGTIDIIKNTVAVGASFVDVKAGDTIELEIRSSATAGAEINNIVTIGDQRESFTVTTAP